MTTNDETSRGSAEIIYIRDDGYFSLTINYESGAVITSYKCHLTDKLNDILRKFANKLDLDYSSIHFQYGGKIFPINESKEKISQIINVTDKESKSMTILAYKIQNTTENENVKIRLEIENRNPITLQGKKTEALKEIFKRNIDKIKITNLNYFIFKYGNREIDLNNNFNDIANNTDKRSLMLIISLQLKINPSYNSSLFCQKYKYYIIIGSILIVAVLAIILYFALKSDVNSIKSEDENIFNTDIDISSDISSQKCSIKGCKKCDYNTNGFQCLDCGDLIPIKRDGIIKQCLKCDEEGFFVPDNGTTCEKCSINGCKQCKGPLEDIECIDCGDLIPVYEKGKFKECNCETGLEEKCLTCDKILNQCTSCNIGYKLVNGECKQDFFIKATYYISIEGYWELFYYDYHKKHKSISQLILDGKIINTITEKYNLEIGEHIAYFKFRLVRTSYYTYFFGGNKFLKSVTFSDFNESFPRYIPDIAFTSMFENCENLISVDFSKIAYSFLATINYLFKNCTNLVNVNFNFKNKLQARDSAEGMFCNCSSLISIDLSRLDTTSVTSFKNLFYGCKSLTSIDLSMLDVKQVEYLENMFYGCNSLQNINLNNWKLDSATDISFMFYDCNSLKYLDLSSFRPPSLKNMNNTFYNCYSLTSINLNKLNTTTVTDMSYLFYNCSSLKILDISSFHTIAVTSMRGLFKQCRSLTSLILGENFVTNSAIDIAGIFLDCNSLTSLNLEKFDTSKASYFQQMFCNCYNLKEIDISNFRFQPYSYLQQMFSGCYSLTSVNFQNELIVIYNYTGLFYNCPNLKYANISFISSSSYYYPIFNSNISDSGEIILNNNYYTIRFKAANVPNGWNYSLYP